MYPSLVRTVVPLVVGVLLAQAAKVGLNLPEGAVEQVVTVVLGTAYFALARALEQYWPAVGRVLLSAGLTRQSPVAYTRETSVTGH